MSNARKMLERISREIIPCVGKRPLCSHIDRSSFQNMVSQISGATRLLAATSTEGPIKLVVEQEIDMVKLEGSKRRILPIRHFNPVCYCLPTGFAVAHKGAFCNDPLAPKVWV